tara:strand:- start:203 stop:646 length:444 start_codon:yes stop_codon:yes gene_type:complete
MHAKLVAAAAMFCILVCPIADACSCDVQDNASEEIDYADIVFIGEAISEKREAAWHSAWRTVMGWFDQTYFVEDRGVVTRFSVKRMIKGPSAETISVSHLPGTRGVSCGVSFPINETIVVRVREWPYSGLITSSCLEARFPVEDYTQ